MYCPDCGRRNDAEAQFCSGCGIAFAGGQARVPISVLEPHELVRRAAELKARGQLEAAIEACRRAVLAEPRHRGAHALLGLLHEQKGQTTSAIREYRVVLEIDPNSTAEREKLDMLLNDRAEDAAVLGPPSRRWGQRGWRLAAIGAAGLVVAALVLGGNALVNSRKQRPQGPDVAMTTPRARTQAARPVQGSTAPAMPAQTARPPYPVRAHGVSPFGGVRTARAPVAPSLPSPTRRAMTPRALTARSTPPVTPQPPRIPPLILGSGAETSPPAASRVVTPVSEGPLAVRPVPNASGTPTGPIEVVTETPPPEGAGPTGHIEIWPSVGVRARPPTGTASPAERPSEATAESIPGRSHQLAGGQLRQQGQHAQAIAKYQSAIAAYTNSIQDGSAGAQAAKGIESCKRAIAACQAALGER